MTRLPNWSLAAGLALFGAASGTLAATEFQTPLPVASLASPLNPGYHHVFSPEIVTPLAQQARGEALRKGVLLTVPTWTQSFTISGVSYTAHIIGTAPSVGGGTVAPTVIVPIRLTISDYSVNGKTPLVLDANQILPSVLASPFFNVSTYASGDRQFIDGMLHTDFPGAVASWSVNFSPTVAATLSITTPKGAASVYKDKSGAYLVTIKDDNVLDAVMTKALASYPPSTIVVFVTYNALEHDAFGYHDFVYTTTASGGKKAKGAIVYTYTSWLVGVDDAFAVPSPDATTLAHEIAELTYDPLITSLTLKWGDAFNNNKCFQSTIEVGDAIEDAPANLQLARQTVTVDGVSTTYTVQNDALLAWFERETPSPALGGAYSFPSPAALTSAAPLTCVR